MKHINESIIGRKGAGNMKFPRDPKQLEHVSDYKINPYNITFTMNIPFQPVKNEEVVNFIWSMVFEKRISKPNPTQWVMNYLQKPDVNYYSYHIIYNKFGKGMTSSGGVIQNKTPLFNVVDKDIWNNIYKKVKEFDKNIGLSDIAITIAYTYSNELERVNIYLN